MKHLLINLLLVGVVIGNLKAQIGIGARMGLNLGLVSGLELARDDNWLEYSLLPRPGFSTSVMGEFRMLHRESVSLLFQPEFAYEQKGYVYHVARVNEPHRYTSSRTELDYFNFPVTFKMLVGRRKLRGYFGVGAYVGLMLKQRIYIEESDGDIDIDYYNKLGIREIDAGVIFGGGLELTLGPGALFFDLRYAQGLISPWNNTDANWQVREYALGQNVNSKTVLNAVPSISVGYMFRFGKKSNGSTSEATPSKPTAAPTAQTTPATITERKPASDPQPAQQSKPEARPEPTAPVKTEPETAPAPKPQSVTQPPAQEVGPEPTRPDFSAMTELNKRLVTMADAASTNAQRSLERNAIMGKFVNSDAMVVLLKNGNPVEYMTIIDFMAYIELNHYRYKITNLRTDANGKITEASATRIN